MLDQHAGANHQNLFDNITLNVDAMRDKNGPYYPIWDGSGAGYWQPGHGRYNTTWNLKVNVRSGADRKEVVTLGTKPEAANHCSRYRYGNQQKKGAEAPLTFSIMPLNWNE